MLKSFSEFEKKKLNEADLFSWDSAKNLFGKGLDAISDVVKAKVTAQLLEKLGIKEGSIFSKLVENFVETIPVGDYYSLLFKGKASASYLAPKAAQATVEFLQEKGLDGIAQALGIDEKGLIYRSISEMISNETSKGEFKKTLEEFYLGIFGGFESISPEELKKSLTSSEKEKISSNLVQAAKSSGADVDDAESKDGLLNAFFGNLTAASANPAQTGTTSGNVFSDFLAK
jgi:hypothetical protein